MFLKQLMYMINFDNEKINLLFESTPLCRVLPQSKFQFLNPFETHKEHTWAVLSVQKENEFSAIGKEQLFKILEYLKQNPENTPIAVVYQNQSASIIELFKKVNFKNLIVFGGNREVLGLQMDLKRYHLTVLSSFQFFCCDTLEHIAENKNDAKQKLKAVLLKIIEKQSCFTG